MSMPDFLCIGAQKSGTTWLDANVRFHPNVWMPPVKEIHYFDRHRLPYVLDLFHRDPRTRSRFLRRVHNALRDRAVTATQPRSFVRKLRWYLRFILMFRSDQWYASLFSPGKGQIAGDVTPAYARLPEEAVAQVYSVMPNAKIIFLLRNPIERMWSEAAMYYDTDGYQGVHTIPPDTIRQFFKQATTTANSTYTQTLRRWQAFYPDDRIFIGFFEQLRHCPKQLLADIFEFLELPDARVHIPDTVHCRIHARDYAPPPGHLARELAQQFIEEIELLHQTFSNSYTSRWLDCASQHLAAQHSTSS